ncbi:hypothetical protein AAHE18_13G339900 [Arachis hypogaea]
MEPRSFSSCALWYFLLCYLFPAHIETQFINEGNSKYYALCPLCKNHCSMSQTQLKWPKANIPIIYT